MKENGNGKVYACLLYTSQGMQPIIGYNHGAMKPGRVLLTLKYGVLAGTAFTCLLDTSWCGGGTSGPFPPPGWIRPGASRFPPRIPIPC